jgi:hypothetical protein
MISFVYNLICSDDVYFEDQKLFIQLLKTTLLFILAFKQEESRNYSGNENTSLCNPFST